MPEDASNNLASETQEGSGTGSNAMEVDSSTTEMTVAAADNTAVASLETMAEAQSNSGPNKPNTSGVISYYEWHM